MVVASLALVAVVALTVASIGSAKPAATDKFRVALVTDIGGLNDKGFNASAYNGLKVAQRQYGVQGRVFISKSGADYVPNITTAARQGYDLVVAVGFLMGDATAAVAKQFPKTKFAIVDVSAPTMAVVLARRARELERATLGKAGGARAAQIGRLLGILGLCLAASATIAVAVYELLVAVE